MTSLSVIIPVYNRAHLIGETLLSLLNQTLPADEIIVVDDGSIDDSVEATRAVFAEWERQGSKKVKTPELKILFQKNKGPAAARNAGFKASIGKFVHFFDSDDLAAPNKHEVQVLALEKSGADIAYAPWVKGHIANGEFIPENHVLQQKGLPKVKNNDLTRVLLTNWSIVPHACLFRRSIVEKSGGFPEHLFAGEDQLMFLNCLLVGAKVVHSPGTLELYRTGNPDKITAIGEAQRLYLTNLAKCLVDIDMACQKNTINARAWFGFRRRVWEAIDDLRIVGIDNVDLTTSLKQILGTSMHPALYQIHRFFERKWLGLKVRITGGRTLSSACSGPLTITQKLIIEEMGLKIVRKKSGGSYKVVAS